jgi:hypothetical protein
MEITTLFFPPISALLSDACFMLHYETNFRPGQSHSSNMCRKVAPAELFHSNLKHTTAGWDAGHLAPLQDVKPLDRNSVVVNSNTPIPNATSDR